MSYNTTTRIKKPGHDTPLTPEQEEEWLKCATDKKYWMRNYAFVDGPTGMEPFSPRPYQERIMDVMTDNRFSIFLSGRQTGKCCETNTLLSCRVPLKYLNTIVECKISIGKLHEYVKAIKTGVITNGEQEEKFIKSNSLELR